MSGWMLALVLQYGMASLPVIPLLTAIMVSIRLIQHLNARRQAPLRVSGKHSLTQVSRVSQAPGRRLYVSSNIARRSSKKFCAWSNAAQLGRYGCEAGGTHHPLSPSFGGYL
jgi:hypothetical protein